MERRKFVIGLGSLAAGGAAATGTGAFTSANAERDVTVNVASSDESGYIGLEALEGPNGVFVDQDGSTGGGLSVSIGDTAVGGDGVNEDSDFLFDDLFEVRNQGTQPVWIWTNRAGSVVPYVMDDDGNRRQIANSGTPNVQYDLGPRGQAFHFFVGERKKVGLVLSSQGVATDSDIGGTLEVYAAANKDDVPGDAGFDVQDAPSQS